MTQFDPKLIDDLKTTARRVRLNILKSIHGAQGGHVGGALSAVEIFVYLYFNHMRIDPHSPRWPNRDRFILSKGHAAVGLYAVLAERGYFPVEELRTFDAIDSRLQAHPDMTVTPGLDMSTGSLGLGLSAALGIALGARMLNQDFRTYVMIGDGEAQEGQIWESAFIASRYNIDNVTAILDNNKLQYCDWRYPARMRAMENPAGKFQCFGWRALEIDGHDFQAIAQALEEAQETTGRPTIIIANTVKGKGVSFIEDSCSWHARAPTDEELAMAIEELAAPTA